MNEQQIEQLKKMGSEWEQHGRHRIYFNDLAAWYGLDVSYYNTGNVSYATLDGERISNSEARRIMARLAGKVYYDFADGKFYGRGIAQADLNDIVAAIRAKLSETVAV